MHDFSQFAAFPAVFMLAFFAFALFVPMMAFAAFIVAGKGWSGQGMRMLPWMHPVDASSKMGWAQQEPASTGNAAFDTYRAETIARLDEEAKAFAAYRDRLRAAKDRAAFEQFMDEMTNQPRN